MALQLRGPVLLVRGWAFYKASLTGCCHVLPTSTVCHLVSSAAAKIRIYASDFLFPPYNRYRDPQTMVVFLMVILLTPSGLRQMTSVKLRDSLVTVFFKETTFFTGKKKLLAQIA